MILKVAIVIALLLAAVLVAAVAKPSTFQIQRSITINAPSEKIFALINDLHNWPRWAPQDREYPATRRTFGGAAAGVGATSDWSGSGSTGKGRITIVETDFPSSIMIDADWQRPFAARNVNRFTLAPDASGTRVTWSMTGPNLFMMKLMDVFTNMDRMMGRHFETGLENLKILAEQ